MSDTLSWAGWRISDEGNGGQRKLEANQRGGAGVRQASLAPVGSALDKGEPGGQLSLSGGEGVRINDRALTVNRSLEETNVELGIPKSIPIPERYVGNQTVHCGPDSSEKSTAGSTSTVLRQQCLARVFLLTQSQSGMCIGVCPEWG